MIRALLRIPDSTSRYTVIGKLPAAVLLGVAFLALLIPAYSFAQEASPSDTTRTASDSVAVDSIQVRPNVPETPFNGPDSLKPADPNRTAPKPSNGGKLEEGMVRFNASDSLTFDFKGDREAELYGSAEVRHTSGELSAGRVSLNLDKNTVSAETDTPGDTLSQPVLKREDDKVRSRKIRFNYQTEKGRFEMARTEIQQGALIGEKVKNVSRDVVFVEDGMYSTCTLEHPHYYIKARKMKVVDSDEIFFTRAKLYLLDIPYPLILPFGYVPAKGIDQRRSGLLEPVYAFQNQGDRGIGLQNLGWFQYFNDYLTGQMSFDVFTSGTFYVRSEANYANTGNFSGSISYAYSQDRGLESTDPDFSVDKQQQFRLNHNQQLSPYSNFSTDINLRTQDFYERNSLDIDERAEVTAGSNLKYSYNHPENIYRFGVSVQQNQNFQTSRVSVQGPTATFSLRQMTPFQKKESEQLRDKPAWYESLAIDYQNRLQTRYDFNPIAPDSIDVGWFEALLDPSKYRRATDDGDYIEAGLRHNYGARVQLVSSEYMTISTNLSATEYWYPSTIRKSYNAETKRVETREVEGFAAAREFQGSVSASTNVIGIANKRIGNLVAFRHQISPQISYNINPDFSRDIFGYYRTVQSDSLGNRERYSIFEGGLVGGPSSGEQQSISFSLRNQFQAKQVRRDSTGEKKEKTINLIDQLSASLNYNFAAERFKLSDLTTRMSSNIAKRVTITANANFSFYQQDENGARIDAFLWEAEDIRLARLTQFNFSASTQFEGGQKALRTNAEPPYPRRYDPFNQAMFSPVDARFNTMPIQPLNSPWSVSLSANYSWRRVGLNDSQQTAIINARNIRFKLTPKWDVGTSIGYDFIEGRLTPTRLNLTRQLHLWSLNFQMNPFGENQFYLFRLSINAGQLQGLFQKLPLLNNLQRSSSPINRTGF